MAKVSAATARAPLLTLATRGAAHTRAAAEPHRITVGYTTNLVVAPTIREVRRVHPVADPA